MRIEQLFSKLECKTSQIFSKINDAAIDGRNDIDVFEKDVHILFKFMNLSALRSERYRTNIRSPYRENDFMFQRLFEASRKSGRSGDPTQVWLEHLLYLLETSHEDLLTEGQKASCNAAANTYKHFVENYALQIWKAADGCEFFLNDRLVDFEGDTQFVLGTELKETGHQLIWMNTDDMIHLVLPISPEVAVVFCNESRCWESSFADCMHRLKIPFPQNSLLKNAPHKDIVNVHIPKMKRGKKTYPVTVAWRINIGTLSRDHHQIITSYSLSHAESFVVVRRRAPFVRAERYLKLFAEKRAEVWRSQGFRVDYQDTLRQHKEDAELPPLSQDKMTSTVDVHFSALEKVLQVIKTTQKPILRTKDNAIMSWLAMKALDICSLKYVTPSRSGSDTESPLGVMYRANKAAFEAAYPKNVDHKNLVTIDFDQFLSCGIGDEMFALLTSKIDSKTAELVHADTFTIHWEAVAENSRPPGGLRPERDENTLHNNPSFQSILRAALGFDTLKWMFEERQDILATFIAQIAVDMKDTQPRNIRIRGRRE